MSSAEPVVSPTVSDEADSLSSLEERIQRAVQLVARLRQEKHAALQEAAEARAEASRQAETIRTLEGDRKQVRARIERLLAQIDQVNNA
jgi:hypothetical protein